jgi:hypothetical protein
MWEPRRLTALLASTACHNPMQEKSSAVYRPVTISWTRKEHIELIIEQVADDRYLSFWMLREMEIMRPPRGKKNMFLLF